MNKAIVQTGLCSLVITGLMAVGAPAQSNDPGMKAGHSSSVSTKGSSKLGIVDQHFLKKAAQGGEAEVELGKLATEKASSDEVKKFGQRMVDDHSKANDQLKQLAGSKGVDLPNDLDAKDKAAKARLSKLSGEQFDKAYMSDMVQDHTKDVSEFKRESNAAKDPDVKSFASQTLPTLQDHLKEARSINLKEKKEARMEKKSKSSMSQQ